jgi:hypothetical protein
MPYELNPDRLAITFITDRDGNVASLSAQFEQLVSDIVFPQHADALMHRSQCRCSDHSFDLERGRHKVSRCRGSRYCACLSMIPASSEPISDAGIGVKPKRRNHGPFQGGA